MKVAVASDDEKTIASHFGRTRGFLIFEIENDKIKDKEYRQNTFTGHAVGMHGVDRRNQIYEALKDCKAVIACGMGMKIYDYLKQQNINVFVTEERDAEKAAELYIKGKLDDNPESSCKPKH